MPPVRPGGGHQLPAGLVFNREIDRAAPEGTRLFVGAVDPTPHSVPIGSIAAAAGVVVLAAALTALLLGRRVVRPIGALTWRPGGWAPATSPTGSP